jgi:hypothetical protein
MTITTQNPKWLRTAAAAEYINAKGIKGGEKRLRNLRHLGQGPEWRYFGSVPYTTAEWLDDYIENKMSLVPANRRKRFEVGALPAVEATPEITYYGSDSEIEGGEDGTVEG